MPIMFSYNVEFAMPEEYNRIQSLFERFGWQRVGGSCYRYPEVQTKPKPEDWFNNVVPALMCFRAFILKKKLVITDMSLDAQSSTGFKRVSSKNQIGNGILRATNMQWKAPKKAKAFGERNLKKWLDDVTDAIPY